nr:hypothetical protein [Gammaproteobacteria bacterium]
MTYDLRQLRLQGLLQRIPGTHRYEITALGKRVSLFFTKLNARVIRAGTLATLRRLPQSPESSYRQRLQQLNHALEQLHYRGQARCMKPPYPSAKIFRPQES